MSDWRDREIYSPENSDGKTLMWRLRRLRIKWHNFWCEPWEVLDEDGTRHYPTAIRYETRDNQERRDG